MKGPTVSASLKDVVAYLDNELDITSFDDSSHNGLQVEGPEEVSSVGLAVDACMNSFTAALEAGCDLLLVHHGLFWNPGMHSLTGTDFRRASFLILNQIGLYASHLPLDAHPTLGNNSRLAKMLRLTKTKPFARYHGKHIGVAGELTTPTEASEIAGALAAGLGRSGGSFSTGVVGDSTAKVKRIGIVSGGGTEAMDEAVALGLDALVTGEGPHHANLDALDNGLVLIYGGHYETETLGVQALGDRLRKKFKVKAQFLDVAH
jgi:dinuclear metal center YbgI/SA1388 family protein